MPFGNWAEKKFVFVCVLKKKKKKRIKTLMQAGTPPPPCLFLSLFISLLFQPTLSLIHRSCVLSLVPLRVAHAFIHAHILKGEPR